jgi:hypothetical protein
MTIYKSETFEHNGYLYQNYFDSREKTFYVKVYRTDGRLIKKCEASDNEHGAMLNAQKFIENFEKGTRID